MNARTLRKRLMKNRKSSLFGRRAYLTVALPLSILGRPPFPPPPKPEGEGWKPSGFGYGWWRETPHPEHEGARIWEHLDCCSPSCTDPKEDLPDYPDDLITDEGNGWFRRYEGFIRTGIALPGEDLPKRDAWVITHLDPDTVRQWRDFSLFRDFLNEGETEIHQLFLSLPARAIYPEVQGDRVLFTYAVKWFYPRGKLAFCSELHRAIRRAQAAGIPVRVYRG